jgi:aspartyl-tRNA(Asn)/glutamyl-tRNA(Gln) amidotransferase subunit B
MAIPDSYETVIGLEVHAQLLTSSKLFSGDSTVFGGKPNTQVSAVSLAHPGTLPRLNRKAVALAVRLGLACECEISEENYFARKNYFYPDLPKGYQLSQHTTPICKGGTIIIQIAGSEKKIRLNRIHMEEDAGKSMHVEGEDRTLVDLNRSGVPLVEIVTEPDLRSGEEALLFLQEIRKIVRYLGICDGNMEEGSLRCDANVSVRKKGETRLGIKVEIKNLNSIRHVKKAIDAEALYMIEQLELGGVIRQQTKSFDAAREKSFPIRDKEDADDYRYFADPDLPPFVVGQAFVQSVKDSLPFLHRERIQRYTAELGLTHYDAQVLTEEKDFSDYFEKVARLTTHYKAAANWMLGPVRSWMNEHAAGMETFPILPESIAELIRLIDEKKLNFSIASTKLFSSLLRDPAIDIETFAASSGFLQNSNAGDIEAMVETVINKFPEKVNEYRKGKKGLMSMFVGEVMKMSKGLADPQQTNALLNEKLNAK